MQCELHSPCSPPSHLHACVAVTVMHSVEEVQGRREWHHTALLSFGVPLLFVTLNPVDPPELDDDIPPLLEPEEAALETKTCVLN